MKAKMTHDIAGRLMWCDPGTGEEAFSTAAPPPSTTADGKTQRGHAYWRNEHRQQMIQEAQDAGFEVEEDRWLLPAQEVQS